MAARFWVSGTGTWDGSSTANWSATSNGLPGASAPTSADTVTFDSNSGTGTCTTAAGAACSSCTLNTSTLTLKLGADLTTAASFGLTLGALELNDFVLNCTTMSASNSNTRSINFGSAGQINLTATSGTLWTTSASTGFTSTGTNKIVTAPNGGAGTRTFNFGSLAETEAITLKVTSGTDILSVQNNLLSLDLTGFAGTVSNNTRSIYKNLIVSSGTTWTAGAFITTFAATSGTQQITTAGVTLDFPLIFNGVGGTFQFQDNCTVGSTRTVTLTNGTLDLNSKTLSTGIFSSSNSNTRAITFGAGNITLTGNAATVWTTSTATGFSYTGTPTVNSTYAGSTGTRTFNTGNTEANAVSFVISAGTDTVVIGSAAKNIDFTGFSGTLGTSARTIYGNLTISSGMTVSGSTSATTFGATSGTQQITTNGKTIDLPLTFNGIGGTFAFQDALTQGSTRAITLTNGTLQFKAGVTSTIGSLTTSGTNQKYLQSTLAGSQATLSDASGTNAVSYTTIQDINATGGATWNAFLTSNNVNAGNNTGWDWYYEPGEYMYTRRKTKRLLIQ